VDAESRGFEFCCSSPIACPFHVSHRFHFTSMVRQPDGKLLLTGTVEDAEAKYDGNAKR
jgi:hypothetical protein